MKLADVRGVRATKPFTGYTVVPLFQLPEQVGDMKGTVSGWVCGLVDLAKADEFAENFLRRKYV